jgi:probable phosphoglycerate mutase
MHIFLVRHGQSEYNVNYVPGMIRPFTDPLTSVGEQQAHNLAERLKSKSDKSNIIYCSPYTRTLETADIIAASLGGSVKVEQGLRESDDGQWATKSLQEIEKEYDQIAKTDRYTFRAPNGESWLDVATRVKNVIDYTKTDGAIYVTHLTPIRTVLCLLQNLDPEQWQNSTALSPGVMIELDSDEVRCNIIDIWNQ